MRCISPLITMKRFALGCGCTSQNQILLLTCTTSLWPWHPHLQLTSAMMISPLLAFLMIQCISNCILAQHNCIWDSMDWALGRHEVPVLLQQGYSCCRTQHLTFLAHDLKIFGFDESMTRIPDSNMLCSHSCSLVDSWLLYYSLQAREMHAKHMPAVRKVQQQLWGPRLVKSNVESKLLAPLRSRGTAMMDQ